ncbi:MAG: crossover junction endodeoxyribonuclease RuvC [Planctomycetota bacterium]
MTIAMRVLGFDPGLRLTGFGCVEGDSFRATLVEAGVIRLTRGAGPVPPIGDRLVELERDVVDAIERTNPDAICVESLFAHKAFPATAVAMGHARGVLLLCARRARIDLIELAPRLVKSSITGSGRASKEQMQLAIQSLFALPAPPNPPDVADALAIAVAGLRRAAAPTVDAASPGLDSVNPRRSGTPKRL